MDKRLGWTKYIIGIIQISPFLHGIQLEENARSGRRLIHWWNSALSCFYCTVQLRPFGHWKGLSIESLLYCTVYTQVIRTVCAHSWGLALICDSATTEIVGAGRRPELLSHLKAQHLVAVPDKACPGLPSAIGTNWSVAWVLGWWMLHDADPSIWLTRSRPTYQQCFCCVPISWRIAFEEFCDTRYTARKAGLYARIWRTFIQHSISY